MESLIITREEYEMVVERGFQPLLDNRFEMDIILRIDIQKELFGHCVFGRGNIPAANERFYRWIWENKKHICEETMRPLHNYSAKFISHILTRGANPAMAHDPRNINILCLEMHNKWENGNREEMRIFAQNQKIIEKLRFEYNLINRNDG